MLRTPFMPAPVRVLGSRDRGRARVLVVGVDPVTKSTTYTGGGGIVIRTGGGLLSDTVSSRITGVFTDVSQMYHYAYHLPTVRDTYQFRI